MKRSRKYTPDEDAPLLASWYRGDTSSFETLVRKYQKRVFNISFLISGDYECSAAAVQSAFVIAYLDGRNLRSTLRFSSWLIGLAIRESRNLLELSNSLQSTSVSPPGGLEDATVSGTLQNAVKEPSPSSGNYEEAQLQDRLRDCIRSLPGGLAEVLVLKYVRGYGIERISEILQVREDVIIARLFEAQESTIFCLRQADASIRDDARAKLVHPEIRRNFSAYLDNSADGEESVTIKKHLRSCGSCRDALAELEWCVEYLKSLPDVEPPSRLLPNVMASIRSGVAPVAEQRITPDPKFRTRIVLAVTVLALLGLSWYLLSRNGKSMQQAAVPSMADRGQPRPESPKVERAAKPEGSMTFMRTSPQRPTPVKAGAIEEPPPQRPLPQPQAPMPAAQEISPPVLPQQPRKTAQEQRTERKTITDKALLPTEWGEESPAIRPGNKKPSAAKGARSSGDLSVSLTTTDPVAAAVEIERAITGVGGKITGRAFNQGSDIFYTRIEVDRFFDLMSRLGKTGRILELPQPPDGAEGAVDLIITWH